MSYPKVAAAVAAALGLSIVSAGVAFGQQTQSGTAESTAQAQPDQVAQDQPAAQPEDLQEVVVTAERRSNDVLTTPIQVTAISGQQLATQQVNTTIEDLQSVAPSFTVNGQTGGFENINIRGVGNSSLNPSVTTGVAVIRDGIPDIETNALGEPFYDMRDTEILRGPQGTFVGASSTGGALLINSEDPNLKGTNGYAEAIGGDYTDRRVDGAVNLQATDTFALRLAVNAERRNSFYHDEGEEGISPNNSSPIDPGRVDDTNFRLGALWKPNDAFQALLKVEINNSDTEGAPSQLNQNSFPDPLTGLPVHVPYYQYSTHEPYLLNYESLALENNISMDRYGLELRYTLPDGIVLRSLSGYQHHNFQSTAESSLTNYNAGVGYTDIGPSDNNYYQEFNVISPTTGRLSWIGGAAFFYRNTPVYSGSNTLTLVPGPLEGPPSPETQLDIVSVTRSAGVFGQVSYQLIDTLQLQLGARENWDNNYNGGQVLVNVAPGVTIHVANNGFFEDSTPTAKVGLNWTPVAGEFVYAFATRGYKSGGTNVVTGAPFDPEHVNDFELGLKSRLLDGRLQTQIGAYYMKYQDMQEDIYNAYAGYMDEVVNLGNSTIKGVEASAQSRIAGLGIDLGLAYNDSVLGAINNPAALVDGGVVATYRLPLAVQQNPNAYPQCAGGAAPPACFNYAPYTEVISGEQNPYSPKFTANLTLDYAIPVGDNTLRPLVSYSHTAKQYASLFQEDSFYLMPARNLWDASLSYEAGTWLAQLYVKNLTNSIYISGYSGNAEYYGDPRQMGVRIKKSF